MPNSGSMCSWRDARGDCPLDGRLSPYERWMAYSFDEAGRDAIYIRRFVA
jgi:hypothetical protein